MSIKLQCNDNPPRTLIKVLQFQEFLKILRLSS
jgi:hypothetical protein